MSPRAFEIWHIALVGITGGVFRLRVTPHLYFVRVTPHLQFFWSISWCIPLFVPPSILPQRPTGVLLVHIMLRPPHPPLPPSTRNPFFLWQSEPLPKTLPSKAVVLNTAGASAEHFKTRPSKAVVLKTGGASAENFKTTLQKRLC